MAGGAEGRQALQSQLACLLDLMELLQRGEEEGESGGEGDGGGEREGVEGGNRAARGRAAL